MIKIKVNDSMQSLEPLNRKQLVTDIHALIGHLNKGYTFELELAEEWVDYLLLLLAGHKDNLSNPYGDIHNYDIQSFSQSTPDLDKIDSLYLLDELPTGMSLSTASNTRLSKSLFITALGGTDSTFYKGLSPDEAMTFANEFYSQDLVAAFEKYNAVHLIPRGFVAKKTQSGKSVTNVESMIIQAYAAGIRHIAIIANAMTFRAVEEYLEGKFHTLADLDIIVTAQPLLPRLQRQDNEKYLYISEKDDGYPGGHGHGFKYCLTDKRVRDRIAQNELDYFIFTNGDNAAVLNWGGEHFEKVLAQLDELKKKPEHSNLHIGFFLVWEYLRKGGFSFLLTDKETKVIMPQIYETELAAQSGANINQLKKSRGGYNTNVAVGVIQDVYEHLRRLPLALKQKTIAKDSFYSFEASLATAMTTFHIEDGKSKFDPYSSINILGPKSAIYQHWSHIALRKREDLFAFHSSLYKNSTLSTRFGDFSVILTDRDATKKYPSLSGNIIDACKLNTKDFFEIFANAYFDVDEFYGTLHIELLQADDKPRGEIRFENNIVLKGDENAIIECIVPAGEQWVVSNCSLQTNKKKTITDNDAIVQKVNAANQL